MCARILIFGLWVSLTCCNATKSERDLDRDVGGNVRDAEVDVLPGLDVRPVSRDAEAAVDVDADAIEVGADSPQWWEGLPENRCASADQVVPSEPYRPPGAPGGTGAPALIWETEYLCPEKSWFGVTKWQLAYDEFSTGPAVVGMTAKQGGTLGGVASNIVFLDPPTGQETSCVSLNRLKQPLIASSLSTLGGLDSVATVLASYIDPDLELDPPADPDLGKWLAFTVGLDGDISEYQQVGVWNGFWDGQGDAVQNVVTGRGEQLFVREGRVVAADLFSHEFLWSVPIESNTELTIGASSATSVWAASVNRSEETEPKTYSSTLYELDGCGVATTRFETGRRLHTPIELRDRFVVEHTPHPTDLKRDYVAFFDRQWNRIGPDIECEHPVTLDEDRIACIALEGAQVPVGTLKVIDSNSNVLKEIPLDFADRSFQILGRTLVASTNETVIFLVNLSDGNVEMVVQPLDGSVATSVKLPIKGYYFPTRSPPLVTPTGLVFVLAQNRVYGYQTNFGGLSRSTHPRGNMGGNANRGWVQLPD